MIQELFAKFPAPPASKLLGAKVLSGNAQDGSISIAFEGKAEFLNPAGFVQGGMLAAMLDDTMGPAVLLASNGTLFTSTIDMHVSFLAPAKQGRFVAEGRVVKMGKTVAFMEGLLRDSEGTLVARASGAARVVPVSKLPGRN